MKVMKLMETKDRALSAVWQQNHHEQAAGSEGICPLPELPVCTFLTGNTCSPLQVLQDTGEALHPTEKHLPGNGNRDDDNYQVLPQSEGC